MATEEKRIKHFSHTHMLEVSRWERHCRMCNQDIPFTIHKSCSSTIQQSLQHHPFHPHHSLFLSDEIDPLSLCNACGSDFVKMSAYTCFDCSFTLHVVCASLTPTTKTIQSQIRLQSNHPHPLISCDLNKTKCKYTYTCSCCFQPFDDERSVVYVCLECKGLLHKTCAQLPTKVDHPFHPLILLPQKPSFFGLTCGACSQKTHSFIYHCSECEFYLDIPCASLSPKPAENNELGQVRRFSHSHPVILCDNNRDLKFVAMRVRFLWGIRFVFAPNARFYCMNHVLICPTKLSTCFTQCTLSPSATVCMVNARLVYVIHVVVSTNVPGVNGYVDVRCVLSKPKTMMSKIHPHPLALFNKPNYGILCTTCRQCCITPFFRCVLCHFDLHIHCISILPPTLKYFNHVHALTLIRSPIKDYPDEDE